jgi:hypothetical protein
MVDKFGIFEVGGRYENRKGPYEVIGISPPQIRIRYDSGEIIDADLSIQAQIIANMAHLPAPTHSRDANPRRTPGSGQPRPGSPNPSRIASSDQSRSGPPHADSHRITMELTPGQVYRRRELHAVFRGQEQAGICTPRDFPIILLFTGQSGGLYGYKDYWDAGGVFHYFGQGQVGDMEFIRGNRAIRDHVVNKRALHLFETIGNGEVRHVGVMTCIGYDYLPDVPDVAGRPRTAIVFRLKSD